MTSPLPRTWLGTTYPLIQAPMAGVQGARLAVAVCEAGGLGSLPCAMLSPDAMREELALIRSGTSKPYNVNFFCHAPPPPSPEVEAAWRARLGGFYREHGIDSPTLAAGGGRAPFDHAAARLLAEVRPPVVSFHFGLPEPELLESLRSWRPMVISSATTVDEARRLEARGVDAIVAQGLEAGGHRGMFLSDDLTTQVGTFALVRQLVKAVRVPVIAAGGIADAAGIRAALALGAAAVQVGTAYLRCDEATTSAVHRRALASDAAKHTAITNIFTGRPARGIVNRAMRELGAVRSDVPPFPLAASAMAPLRATAEAAGSGDFSPLWAGQNGDAAEDGPAAEITRRLAEGFD